MVAKKMNFDAAFERLIGFEGDYSFDNRDPGGETHWGISKRAYPNLNIRDLTLEDAKNIYRRDYWDRCKCEDMPYTVAFQVFDMAVNQGVHGAIIALQDALGVSADGDIGPVTLATAQVIDPFKFSARFCGARLLFYTGLNGWDTYGKGWTRRVASQLRNL
jgi:lysozyme family protein